MNLEQQVVRLELAKEMKELGFKQDSLFYWCPKFSGSGSPSFPYRFENSYYLRTWDKEKENAPTNYSDVDFYSAYTVAELGEMLPVSDCIIEEMVEDKEWYVKIEDGRSTDIKTHQEVADTEADARAMMLIYLAENNLINPNMLIKFARSKR